MSDDDLVVIVAAIFCVQHNLQRPLADADELLERAYATAETFVKYRHKMTHT